MNINSISGGRPVYQSTALSKKPTAGAEVSAHTDMRDKVDISAEGLEKLKESRAQTYNNDEYLKDLQKQTSYLKLQIGDSVSTKNDGKVNVLSVSPKLLEKMQSDPETEKMISQKLKDVERAHRLVDTYMKATGSTVVCSHAYLDENGNYCCFAVTERKDEMNEELRAQAQENAEKLLSAVREKNAEAADRLASLMSEAQEKGVLILDEEDMKLFGEAAKALEATEGEAEDVGGDEAIGSEKVSGCVAINAQKLARMLAAAKTRSQIRAIMAKIQSDLKECETGKAQGLDVDEASVSAAESLLSQAKSQMATADDREPTPEEEMAQAMASLM